MEVVMKLQGKVEVLVSGDNNEPILEYAVDATVHSFEGLVEHIMQAGLALEAALSGKSKAAAAEAIAKASK
jgi:hypothetical protein